MLNLVTDEMRRKGSSYYKKQLSNSYICLIYLQDENKNEKQYYIEQNTFRRYKMADGHKT